MTNVLECIDTNSDGRIDISGNVSITKTCPCNIQRFLKLYKMKNFSRKYLLFFLFLLKTLIVGTR